MTASPTPASLATAREDKDEAYRQRNHLVAALARLYPSGTRRTNIKDWDHEWHGCVYIDLPSGQISYHYHDSDAHLFADLPLYTKEWDGHDKEVVHQRLMALDAAGGTRWRPIAEAPEDGTRLLGWKRGFPIIIIRRHDPGGKYECWVNDRGEPVDHYQEPLSNLRYYRPLPAPPED